MKTKRAARVTLKFRFILLCLAVVSTGGLGMQLGDSFAMHTEQAATLASQCPQATDMNMGELMAGLR